jgi:hypothetical protein
MTKDEILKLAREGGIHLSSSQAVRVLTALDKYAAFCRAPLEAEVERLHGKVAQQAVEQGDMRDKLMHERDALLAEVEMLRRDAESKPHCKECTKWRQEQADNSEWIKGVAEGRRIVEKLAAKAMRHD